MSCRHPSPTAGCLTYQASLLLSAARATQESAANVLPSRSLQHGGCMGKLAVWQNRLAISDEVLVVARTRNTSRVVAREQRTASPGRRLPPLSLLMVG